MLNKNAIYILKGKDCTNKIRSIHRLTNGMYEVCFLTNSRKFTYSPANVQIRQKKQSVNTQDCLVLIAGKVQSGVRQIDDYDDYSKLLYKTGFEKLVKKHLLKLVHSCLSNTGAKTKFDYFKSIARAISLDTEEGKNILGSYYERISFIREDTLLANFLIGEIPDNEYRNERQNIFPFGFNESQKLATENAMNHRLSVIEGPPGTGKTQTILNLIANIIKNEKTVAVVSSNNSATDNIYEKLQTQGVDCLAARLGSMKNKQAFVHGQCVPPEEKLRSWKLEYCNMQKIDDELNRLAHEIDAVLAKKNQLALLQTELDSILTESKHFLIYCKDNYLNMKIPTFRKPAGPGKLLDLWYKAGKKKSALSLFDKIGAYFFCGIKINSFYKQNLSTIIAALQKSYYKAKIDELEQTIENLENGLLSNNVDEKISRHADLSMKIFRAYIAKKYLEKPRKSNYALDDLWKNSEKFIEDYPVVLSTTYSLRSNLSNNYVYDYAIVDEASQVDLATFVLVLSCAKNAVVVGDKKQLPNVLDAEAKLKDRKIFSQFNLSEKYMFSKHSALSAITDLFGDQIPSQLLREHYRCHPKIIGFCNKMFYDNQLIILTPEIKDTQPPLKIYTTVKGNHARENHINQRQIDVTLQEVVPKEGLDLLDGTVGIVTPYRNQAQALSTALTGSNVLAATVDKFQGRERETIIINTVDNKISDFASNPNRLNVAISRARRKLIVVTNGNESSTHTGIDELIDYIKYNNYEVVSSEIRSIFDNLYSSHYKRKVKKARKGSSLAEDWMLELISAIYKENNFTNLGTVLEYPLKLLVDTKRLEGREKEYAQNDWTRVDFVIFRKTSKQPLLALEVDGWAFHNANNEAAKTQRERDAIKNKLLNEANIPLIRFKTIGSNEKIILTAKLEELLDGR
ncbi:MAG: AAA family ATPase [Candidatus Margulisbacteria bacterium]|jgi:superfamily I DNA and/or RNA helicase|nr:AAA family ATPase [Candidatus Margulisiibacteriota bacterium]